MQNLTRFLIAIVVVVVGLTACTSSNNSTAGWNTTVDFPDQAMTAAEIDALKAGDPAYAVVDREEGRRLVPITLGVRYTIGSDDYLTFRDDDFKFGAGDSGSPILNSQGKTMGALSGTFGGNNIVITPISSMLANVGTGTLAAAPVFGHAAHLKGGSVENRLAWFAMGVGAEGLGILRSYGITATDLNVRLVSYGRLEAYKAAATNVAAQLGLTAGQSIAVVPFSGSLVNLFAVGTATHTIDNDNMIAFGHPMNWDGAPSFSMPVTAAKVIQFVRDPVFGSFKLAVPSGEVMGGIIQDRSKGILISRVANVDWIELVVNAHGFSSTHKVCRLDDQWYTMMFADMGLSSVVQNHFDIADPGVHQTTIIVSYKDGSTKTTDLGDVFWYYGGGSQVMSYVMNEISTVTKIEVTITD